MIKQSITALIFVGWATLSAQNPTEIQPSVPQAKTATCSVQGTVVTAAGAEPLRGARVVLTGADGRQAHTYSASTDGEGRFCLSEVAGGRYRFQASKNGYVAQGYHPDGSAGQDAVLELLDGQQIDKVLFRLSRAAVIQGRITDENGEPVAGVQVEALAFKAPPAWQAMPSVKSQWVAVKSASTNDLGEFRLFGLPPGSYYVAAIESGMGDLASGLAVSVSELTVSWVSGDGGALSFESEQQGNHHPPTYYPGVTQRSQAQRIHVAPGQETRIDISLRPEKTVAVSGRVIDPAGKPAAQTFVAIQPQERQNTFSDFGHSGLTDAQGKFEIKGVLPGAYTASATSLQEGKPYSAQQALEVAGENVTGIQLHLTSGADLSGRVIAAGGANVELGELQAMLLAPSGASMAKMHKDGTFTLSNVQQGTYGVQLFGLPEGWYVSSIAFGENNVLEDGLKLGEAGTAHTIEVILKQGTGQLEGTVLRKNDPAPGSVVRLAPEHASAYRPDLSRTATTDQRGHFIIKDVVPGRYRAVATSGDPDGEDDQESAVESGAETGITLGERESKTVQLTLKTPGP
jgi:protocatechuate 3,4-dioxygenase beta subunit